MSNKTSPRRFRSGFWLIGIVVALAVGAVFGVDWYLSQRNHAADIKDIHNTSMEVLGLNKSADHKLNPRYQLNDAEMVAATPTDPAKLVDPDTLTFCYIGGEDKDRFRDIFKDFTDYLSKATGKPVEYVLFKSPTEEIQAIRDGKLHVAGLNTGAVPLAVNEAGFVPAYILGALDKGTSCEIIVPNDSPITKPEDIKGKTVEYVEPNSNTGYKVPIAILSEKFNMKPPRDYEFNLSYGHEASIRGIAAHKLQAAAVASDVLELAIANKLIAPSDFHVIYKSDRYPAAAFGFAYNLKPALQAKIREAFKTYPWPDGPMKQEFAPAGQDRFTPTNYKQDWSAVRVIDNGSGTPYNVK